MYHATEGFLASTNELMSLHVSQATRRAAPMAASVLARLAAIQTAHDALPRPPRPGAASGFRRPLDVGGPETGPPRPPTLGAPAKPGAPSV